MVVIGGGKKDTQMASRGAMGFATHRFLLKGRHEQDILQVLSRAFRTKVHLQQMGWAEGLEISAFEGGNGAL